MPPLYAEAVCNGGFVDFRADDAESACDSGCAGADVDLARNVVEVDPSAVICCDDALSTKNDAVGFFVVQIGQNCLDFFCSEFLCGFDAPACENFVSMMMMMMFIMAMTASAMLIVMVMFVVMLMAIAMLIVVMMIMVMLVAVAMLIVALMLVVMVVLVAVTFLIMVMVVMLKFCQIMFQSVVFVKSFQYLHSLKLTPWSSNNHSILIMLTEKSNHSLNLVLGRTLGVT